jgi:hypothetical protein
MDDPSHIVTKDRLAEYSQISTAIFHVLDVAQAGGLSEKQAKTIYRKIMDAYSTLNGEAFWLFKDELIRILVTPDASFSGSEEPRPTTPPSWN